MKNPKTKYKLILVLVFLFCKTISAQKPECGVDAAQSNLINNFPGIANDLKNARDIISQQTDDRRSLVQGLITIPVVVHVIYNLPSENISDAQVHSQIDVLNRDFRRLNADTVVTRNIFKPFTGDAHIEFCLAQRDPNGIATSGITRTFTTHTSWDCTDSMKFNSFGGKDAWPNTDYLNIWVVNLNCANGYAYYPGTPAAYDGVVVHYYVFGDTGNVAPGHTGRTTVHEVGHYLGLYHTFDYSTCGGTDTSTCGGGGDYICDTPASDAPGYGCDTTLNTCTDTPIDLPNQIENYMDYADDVCRNMFTQDQISRMRAGLSAYRFPLLTSTGCISPLTNYYDAALVELLQPKEEICVSSFTPVVKIANTGNTILTSCILHYQLDGAIWNQVNWTGNLNSGTSVSYTLPSINISPGTHSLSVYVSDPDSMPDQNASNDMITILFNVLSPGNGLSIPYTEGFETSIFPPTGWYAENPGYDQAWKKFSSAGGFGTSNSSACYPSFYNGSNHTIDRLISPKFDLTSFNDAYITFDVSYSQPTSTFSGDTLIVYYSTDCGENWNYLWQKGGNSLSTAPTPAVFDEFIPDSSQWRTETINASSAIGNPLVSFMFEERSNWTNNLYIDNINITFTNNIEESESKILSIYPNPSGGIFYVDNNTTGNFSCEIFSVIGKKITSFNNLKGHSRFNLTNFSSGVYFAVIKMNGKTFNRKIIIEK